MKIFNRVSLWNKLIKKKYCRTYDLGLLCNKLYEIIMRIFARAPFENLIINNRYKQGEWFVFTLAVKFLLTSLGNILMGSRNVSVA